MERPRDRPIRWTSLTVVRVPDGEARQVSSRSSQARVSVDVVTDLHARPTSVHLDDKFLATDGRVLLSGIQALVRLTLDQRRLDAGRGLNTGIYVSGYPGSPLGGLDLEFGRARRLLDSDRMVFHPGLNEEIAATSVAGTQLLRHVPGRTRDGVTGFWYGKNPGLDRAADAIRHGNIAGTAPLGGAVAWIGDDPACKSSTLPSGCELLARSLHLPLLAPSTVGEVLTLGLHAVALSRMSGLWAGLKIVADIADASATVDLTDLGADIPRPDPSRSTPAITLLGPEAVQVEEHLLTVRLPRVHEYAREAGLNRIVADTKRARLGIVAGGSAYATLVSALDWLGIDESTRHRLGVRIIKIGLTWPLDGPQVQAMVSGLEEVLVIEDKASFLEAQIKDLLYGAAHQPRISGKRDPEGRVLLPAHGVLDVDTVAQAVLTRLPQDQITDVMQARAAHARSRALAGRSGVRGGGKTIPLRVQSLPPRTPYFCSGCPHNRSTRAADDQLIGVGIGCHVMVTLDDDGRERCSASPRWEGREHSGSAWLRSPRVSTLSRTWGTVPSSTRAPWRFERRLPPVSP